jgi:ABC-type glutathione transport system ATPase component
MDIALLEVNEMVKFYRPGKVSLFSARPPVEVVGGVSFVISRNETLGLVGPSGCGKTTVAKLVCGIIRPDSGNISKHGNVDMVFQDPYSSLNPRMKVGQIVGESLYVKGYSPGRIKREVARALDIVKLPERDVTERYPHEFSGGQRQRIALARALAGNPDLLVLDEPVSSLDVSIQAGILNLLKDIQEETGCSYLFISHDLRIVEFMSDRIAVMHEGKIVETGQADDIYRSPRSRYTRRLLDSVPRF